MVIAAFTRNHWGISASNSGGLERSGGRQESLFFSALFDFRAKCGTSAINMKFHVCGCLVAAGTALLVVLSSLYFKKPRSDALVRPIFFMSGGNINQD